MEPRSLSRALILAAALGAMASSPTSQALELAGCPVFPADSIWNTPIDRLPLDVNSETYVSTIGADRPLVGDFGSGLFNGGPIGIPFITVSGSQRSVALSFQYADESDPGPYPIPSDAPIEGGPGSTGDRHVLVLDRDNCKLYEVFDSHPQSDGSWRAGSGAIFDLRSHTLRPSGWTSGDAAGLPILPGLVRYEEVAGGEIRHTLRFTAPQTRRAFLWPARHFASSLTDARYPPMGQMFRLKADFNMTGFAPEVVVILKALQKYGMILSDNGSSWFISGAPDERWNNTRLRDLRRVRGADFEAVDTSRLMLAANSGQARQSQGVANAAAAVSGPVSPGEIVSIYGTNFGPPAPATASLATGRIESELAETTVSFDDARAPLLYVSSTQVNAIVPFAVAGRAATQMRIDFRRTPTFQASLPVSDSTPGIFTPVFNQNYTPNSLSNPADRGAVIVFFGTGGGDLNPAGVDGRIHISELPALRLPVTARIGGQLAEVLYAGSAPGFVAGAIQFNVRVPAGLAPGTHALVVTVGRSSSQLGVSVVVR